MTDILQRYRELRSMGQGESRAKTSAAIEYARERVDCTVAKAALLLTQALATAKETPTRPGVL